MDDSYLQQKKHNADDLQKIADLEKLEQLPDEQLIPLLKDKQSRQNQLAYAIIYNRYHAKLTKYIFRFVFDNHLAEDLYQEAMIKVFTNIEQLEHGERFSSWLYRISANLAIKLRQEQKKDAQQLHNQSLQYDGLDVADKQNINPEAYLLQKEKKLNVESSVLQLPDKFKQVYILRQNSGQSYAKISENLGISIRTAKWRMRRAKQILIDNIHNREKGDV